MSSYSGSISSIGIGTGMDVNGLISQLMSIERKPISDLQKAATAIQSKISLYGTFKSNVSALRDAALALTQATTWSQTTAISSDSSAVSPTTSSSTTPGNYSVQVSSLAASQSVASGAYSNTTDLVGSGSLTLQLGKWTGTSFSPKAGSSASTITVAPGTTLSGLRDTINSSNAGVTASLLSDASGYRLVLRSKDTGEENGFQLTTADASLSNFTYDPSPTSTGSVMSLATSAANATGTINGLPVSSSTNTFSSVVDGLTLTFGKTTTSPVLVSTKNDTDSIKKKITDFVSAYNTLNTFIASNSSYDAATKKGGPLQADSAATSVRAQIRSMLGDTAGTSTVFSRLSDIGIALQRDGSLVAGPKLDAALSNLSETQKMLGNLDYTNAGNQGLAARIRVLADQMLSTDGAITTRTNGLQASLKNNQTRQDDLDERASQTEQRLRAQFTALDRSMAQINGTSSFVTQMIAQYNANRG
jgi:flagellar hook-associated protein 2